MVSAPSPTNVQTLDLTQLVQPGILGFYNCFEVIEIGLLEDGKHYRNVFSIYVGLEHKPAKPLDDEPVFLHGNKRDMYRIKGYKFFVAKRYVSTQTLLEAIGRFGKDQEWKSPVKELFTNPLNLLPPVFCPADSTDTLPINRVLKNNFWNGSYVVELADASKDGLKILIENNKALNAFGAWVEQFISIDLAAVPDRIGNVVIQLPVMSVALKCFKTQINEIGIQAAWHPLANPRPLQGTISILHDGLIIAHSQQDLHEGVNLMVSDGMNYPYRGMVWDTQNQMILGAFSPTVSLGENLTMSTYSDGILNRVIRDGEQAIEIALHSHERTVALTTSQGRPNGTWTERRISDSQIREIVQQKHFLQYGSTAQLPGRSEALEDIRELINIYGRVAAYLWDPYLSSGDLIATLLQCKYSGSDLRAITSPKAASLEKWCDKSEMAADDRLRREHWIGDQKSKLDLAIDDTKSINLEFRMSFGPKGWKFHDRFLIFPELDPFAPKVWSLGASVNHLGDEHAIVQRVAHPQPVLDAFEGLWNRISADAHLVWRSR